MKILIHSNAPWVSTGYGVQCRHLAERLVEDGHDVAISCTYGHQGSTRRWKPANPRKPEMWPEGGIVCYPQGWETNGNDVIHNHAMHHFGGDPLGGWIIPLLDQWVLVNPLLAQFNIAAWTPVDHFPVPPGVLRFFERTQAVPVAMSRFGERLLSQSGLESAYVPLSIDSHAFKATPTIEAGGKTVTARELFDLPDEAFVVGMVAMNKDVGDRKGFVEAFAAFGAFWQRHQDAVLFVHSDPNGMGTSFDLNELAIHCSVPEHAIKFSDNYAYRLGLPDQMMAAAYTAMDVLLAPSHGEGFCVPLIEAQATGTPVIVTDFSAQPELIGAGWKVMGQQQWDPAQHAFYITPFISAPIAVGKLRALLKRIVDVVPMPAKLRALLADADDELGAQPLGVVQALEEAWAADLDELAPQATEFAARYDADLVFDTYWRPLLARMDARPEPLDLVRDEPFDVAVIVPLMREENVSRIVESFAATNDGTAEMYLVIDDEFDSELAIRVKEHAAKVSGVTVFDSMSGYTTSYAEKVNAGFEGTDNPWVLLVGDDVEFHEGWLSEARKLAAQFDVIGTNDSLPMSRMGSNGYELIPGRIRNPDVAAGKHADHFFVRRSYVEKYGACLDGPGVLAPEVYRHWFVDKEIIGLAKARGVFAPCLTSVVEHHHPGYDGLPRDEVYRTAIEFSGEDQKTYADRLPLIDMQRTSLGKR